MSKQIKVTVWNEFRHEKTDENVSRIYPNGIHAAISDFLNGQSDIKASGATLDMPEHGLTEEVLDNTDVLIWWGHMAHDEVSHEIVEKVYKRVLNGMGLIVLHSGHFSRIFRKLMGTSCDLKWREAAEKERLWVVNPSHPIANGLGEYIEIPHTEMYGERFDIPQPDDLVFINWYEGGEVFRGGCCFNRGCGKIFYFSPGHETFPIFYQPEIQQVITNAVRWAKPSNGPVPKFGNAPALEKIVSE